MKKLLIILLVLVLMTSVFTACKTASGTDVEETKTEEKTAEKTQEKAEETAETADVEESQYLAVDEPITVTCFETSIDPEIYQNLNETPTAQFWFEKTGVFIDYIHPASGQEVEQFNLVVVSNDLPDILQYMQWYKGGVEMGIQDNIIIDVEDLVVQYAPNFKAAVLDDPDARKLAYNDNGTLIGFGTDYSLEYAYDGGYPYTGIFIRQDLLDELGLSMPVTIEDWTATLRAFKAAGVSVPLAHVASGWNALGSSHFFASAYGTGGGNTNDEFFQVDGDTRYSKMQPGYKDYLELLHLWYDEALIDRDFITHTFADHLTPMMLDGTSAAAPLHLYYWNNSEPVAIENGFNFVPAPVPVQYEGQEIHLRNDWGFFGGGNGMGITVASEYAKEIVMAYDYLYTEEGKILTNWGIEGESYVIGDDGLPKLSEAMEEDLYRMNLLYCPNQLNKLIDKEHDLIQYPLESQHQAWDIWMEGADASWRMPPGISLTPEEDTRKAEIMTEVNTYADEMVLKFILGEESLDNWDDYVAAIEELNVQEVLDMYNAAIVRYDNR